MAPFNLILSLSLLTLITLILPVSPIPPLSVIDVIKEGQEFVPNSVTINGAIDTSNYNYDEGSKTLKYTFDKDINKEQIIFIH